MVSSIDGRLLTERWTQPVNGSRDKLLTLYESIAERLDGDGWLIGRKSMEYFATGKPRKIKAASSLPRETFIAEGRKGHKIAAVADPSGKLHYAKDKTEDGDHFVAILGEQVSDRYLAELRKTGVSYLFAGPDGYDMQWAMNTLGEDFGIKTLLLEGGGLINGHFLKGKLIDEISLLIYPGIDGLAGVSSIFEYIGQPGELPAEGQSLRHFSTETLTGGMVWLRYAVEAR
jgi:5-amino-6-(5-phosphoribosylamino)uracil reductase